MKIVLVCGGRDYSDHDRLFAVLDELHAAEGIGCIVHGAARGADTLAGQWAWERGIRAASFPANWHRDGKAAGPIRNQRMLDEAKPVLVVAFPGGRGTADMVSRAWKASIPVIEVP